jgi:YidC/Oxa1 family membrane protein insertase
LAIWNAAVELLAHGIVALSALYGGNLGLAIVTAAAIHRLLLFPISLRFARLARERQRRLEELRPETDRLRTRFGDDPARLSAELLALYRARGVSLGTAPNGFALLQWPLLGALTAAVARALVRGVRFLWIADLTRPDLWITGAVASLAGLAAVLAPNVAPSARLAAVAVPALLTLVLLGKASSGLALVWAVSNGSGALQSWALRRRR